MPDGFSWPATAEVCEAKRPGWLPFLSIVQGLPQGWWLYSSADNGSWAMIIQMKLIENVGLCSVSPNCCLDLFW
jgi:hypothetical protein